MHGPTASPSRFDASLPTHHFAGTDMWLMLAARALARADHPALVWEPFEGDRRVWTYAQLAADVEAVAAGLHARGVRRGERLLIHLDNCPEFLLAWLACARIGAVAVTTNTRSAGDEITYFADVADVVGAVTQPTYAGLVSASAPGLRFVVVTATDGGAAPAAGTATGPADDFASLTGDPATLPDPLGDPTAPMSVQFTSGTTSRPKGVLWTHANALWGARTGAVHEMLTPDDVHIVSMPLFHTNAQTYSTFNTLYAGGTVVLQPRFSASRFWDVSLRNGCTWASMIPFMCRALVERPVPPGHRYRLWGNAIGPFPTDPYFGVRTMGWWGMTETVTHGIVSDPYEPGRLGTIGRPAPEYDVAVVDAFGEPVEVGGTGELLIRGVRGLSMFAEYLANPQATTESFDDAGWFRTGDLVTVWPDGLISFSDRAKDMLKVGGENVAASEVERVVLGVPGVREVAVVARRHPMLDQVPFAFVLRDRSDIDADELAAAVMTACRASLADFKVPHGVRVVDELPRSTIEKIAKNVLREQLDATDGG